MAQRGALDKELDAMRARLDELEGALALLLSKDAEPKASPKQAGKAKDSK